MIGFKIGQRPKHFSKEHIQMANRYFKKCSVSPIIREVPIKITVSCHLTLVRVATFKKIGDNKCWQGNEKKNPFYTVVKNMTWFSHCGKQYGDSSKIENRTTIWSNNSTFGYISKGNEISRYLYSQVHWALFTVGKIWKQPSLCQWMNG